MSPDIPNLADPIAPPGGPQPITTRLASRDGTGLEAWTLEPSVPGEGVVMVHGYADYGRRYLGLGQLLARAGMQPFALDLRGHGRSQGGRGALRVWDDYLDDLAALIAWAGERMGKPPRALLGHSMGAVVAYSYLLRREHPFRELVLSSPFLALGHQPPAWKAFLGRLAGRLAPWANLPSELTPGMVSHHPAVVAAYASDELVFHHANAGWWREVQAAQALCRDHPRPPGIEAALVFWGGSDPICDVAVTQAYADGLAVEHRDLWPLEGLYHETLNEIEGPEVRARVCDWLGRRLAAGG